MSMELAREIIGKIELERVRAIVVGFDPDMMMSLHLNPLSSGEETPDTEWGKTEAMRVPLPIIPRQRDLLAAARERWGPDVEVFDCRCTCCSDGLERVVEPAVDILTCVRCGRQFDPAEDSTPICDICAEKSPLAASQIKLIAYMPNGLPRLQ